MVRAAGLWSSGEMRSILRRWHGNALVHIVCVCVGKESYGGFGWTVECVDCHELGVVEGVCVTSWVKERD